MGLVSKYKGGYQYEYKIFYGPAFLSYSEHDIKSTT